MLLCFRPVYYPKLLGFIGHTGTEAIRLRRPFGYRGHTATKVKPASTHLYMHAPVQNDNYPWGLIRNRASVALLIIELVDKEGDPAHVNWSLVFNSG